MWLRPGRPALAGRSGLGCRSGCAGNCWGRSVRQGKAGAVRWTGGAMGHTTGSPSSPTGGSASSHPVAEFGAAASSHQGIGDAIHVRRKLALVTQRKWRWNGGESMVRGMRGYSAGAVGDGRTLALVSTAAPTITLGDYWRSNEPWRTRTPPAASSLSSAVHRLPPLPLPNTPFSLLLLLTPLSSPRAPHTPLAAVSRS